MFQSNLQNEEIIMSALLNSLRWKFEESFKGSPKEECLKLVKWNHEKEHYEPISKTSYSTEQAVAFNYMLSGYVNGYSQRMTDRG